MCALYCQLTIALLLRAYKVTAMSNSWGLPETSFWKTDADADAAGQAPEVLLGGQLALATSVTQKDNMSNQCVCVCV